MGQKKPTQHFSNLVPNDINQTCVFVGKRGERQNMVPIFNLIVSIKFPIKNYLREKKHEKN